MRKKTREVITSLKPEAFTGIYAEIAAETDTDTAVKVYELFRGQSVLFPQRLYSRAYVREFVRQHHQEYSVRKLAKMFGYSDRRIRQFIADSHNTEATVLTDHENA